MCDQMALHMLLKRANAKDRKALATAVEIKSSALQRLKRPKSEISNIVQQKYDSDRMAK